MARYIVDASVIIEYLITGAYTPYTTVMFAQSKLGDRFIIPEFCLLECTNVIWKQMRFQGMDPQRAVSTLKDLRKLPLRRTPMKALLERSLRIAARHQLAVYDSAYIALAKKLSLPLITLDQPQSRAATAEGVVLKRLTDFT